MPILVLSARGLEEDKVKALDCGADDYLSKPFGVNELLARIRVLLRHAEKLKFLESDPIIGIRGLVIDRAAHKVTLNGQDLHLTPLEYKLLVLLAAHAGRVITHSQILKEIWGAAYQNDLQYLRVYMASLRRKIEADPAQPSYLLTEPGVGYRLVGPG